MTETNFYVITPTGKLNHTTARGIEVCKQEWFYLGGLLETHRTGSITIDRCAWATPIID